MGNRLYIGNLSFESAEGDVQRLFEDVGTVVNCDLIVDRFTGKSRGFAFVEMSTDDEAEKAINDLNGKDLDGRDLTVNEARPRP